jgi:uncharacterized protein with PIN domain
MKEKAEYCEYCQRYVRAVKKRRLSVLKNDDQMKDKEMVSCVKCFKDTYDHYNLQV